MTRIRCVAALLATTLLLSLTGAAPAQADPLRDDYGHWGQDCPNGLTVRLGGGAGWRHYMRRAIDGWNWYVAPNYYAAPFITNVVDVAWDGEVQYNRCTIDMDEVAEIAGGYYGYGNAIPFPDNHHYAGGVVLLTSEAWNAYANSFDPQLMRDRLAAHELQHALGLGHNPLCDSVMNTTCVYLTHNHRDRDTLSIIYGHKH